MNQFYDFHGSPGRSTESCRTLKNNLEDLIQRGYFKNYIKWNDESKGNAEAENKRNLGPSQDKGDAKKQKKAPIFVMFEKFGGITDGEAHVRAVTQPTTRIFEVHEEAEIPKYPHMTFTREDCKGIVFPHSDPLVMIVEIAEQPVYRVIIDTKAEVNVIYKSC